MWKIVEPGLRHLEKERIHCMTEISRIGIIGPGRMGRGIALLMVLAGYPVELVHYDRDKLDVAYGQIYQQMQGIKRRLGKNPKSIDQTMELLRRQTSISNVLERNHLVIETIQENLQNKTKLFKTIMERNPSGPAILASNTSSFKIRELLEAGDSQWKHRFIGLHFLNPVLESKLVEIVPLETTHPIVVSKVQNLVTRLGKDHIICQDQPGFVVNRLLVPFLGEAINMVEKGLCSAKDIEKACRLGLRHPIGPLKLVELIGRDTFEAVSKRLQNENKNSQ